MNVLAFAEDPNAYELPGPDDERILTDQYCVTFSPGRHYWSVSVQRVRFGDDVAACVEEVRDLLRRRKRAAAAWTIGPSATPVTVFERLLACGLESESEDGSLILALTTPPKASRTFEVRAVKTLEDHRASVEVMAAAFSYTAADRDDELGRAASTFKAERRGDHVMRLIAWDGDLPVATGRGWFSPYGIYMGGGATIASHRRLGAMASLIGAAWEEAVARDTPALVTHAGPMAAPGLQRLGFESLGRVRHLIDRITP